MRSLRRARGLAPAVALAGALLALAVPACGALGDQDPTVSRPAAADPTATIDGALAAAGQGATTTEPAGPSPTDAPAGGRPAEPTTTEATVTAASAAPVPLAPPMTVTANSPAAGSLVGDIAPYAGLGTWVDVYDWSHYRETTPSIGPTHVDQMAAVGVQTLFIQTAKHDTPELISEPELLLPIIERARAHGINVVAWYLPTLEDIDNDLNRLVASANLDVDGIAVDIESRKVADPAERSARLVDLSVRVRAALPGRAIGAIVMPPVQLEVVNPNFWPGFPWREIAPHYDVWQTMGYWTDRKQSSGYRDPYRYTDENLRRLRNNLGDASAPVSPVGGVGANGPGDIDGFLRAAAENGAMGGSIYDWRTTEPDAWPALQGFRTGR